jgi:hypothetical protein
MVITTPFISKCDELEGIFSQKSYVRVKGLFLSPIGDIFPIEKC